MERVEKLEKYKSFACQRDDISGISVLENAACTGAHIFNDVIKKGRTPFLYGAYHYAMNKSDIVVSIFLAQPDKKLTAQQVKKLLQSELEKLDKDLNEWDQVVNTPIGNAIIKNIGSTRGELSMELLIRDIDLVLKRIS